MKETTFAQERTFLLRPKKEGELAKKLPRSGAQPKRRPKE